MGKNSTLLFSFRFCFFNAKARRHLIIISKGQISFASVIIIKIRQIYSNIIIFSCWSSADVKDKLGGKDGWVEENRNGEKSNYRKQERNYLKMTETERGSINLSWYLQR